MHDNERERRPKEVSHLSKDPSNKLNLVEPNRINLSVEKALTPLHTFARHDTLSFP